MGEIKPTPEQVAEWLSFLLSKAGSSPSADLRFIDEIFQAGVQAGLACPGAEERRKGAGT